MTEKIYLETPEFTGRNVPITEIAKAMGKDPQYVRFSLQNGFFNFGKCIKYDNSSEFNYYCSDKLVWEETGYFRDKKMVNLELISLDSIEEKEDEWLWEPYFAKGKLSMVLGDPGSGKTMFMLNQAALLSTGLPLPFDDENIKRDPVAVIYQTSEDGYDDTIKPRLTQATDDCSKIFFISEDKAPLSMLDSRIEEAIIEKDAKLFILDPIQAYLGADVDINKANEVRPLLKRIGDVAARTSCSIVLVGHMNKSRNKSIYKGLGSIDFFAASRSVLIVGAFNDDPNKRIVIQAKNSLAPVGESFCFYLSKENGFQLGEKVSISADELLEGFSHKTEKQRALDFLSDFLSNGKKSSTEIYEKAENQGITRRTLESAKQELNIKSKKEGAIWYWKL